MKWVYEVSLDYYVGEESCALLYEQFDSQVEAFAFAEKMMSSVLPTETVEVKIKVNPES